MDFGGDFGLWQRRIAEGPEGSKRRLAAFDALDLTQGQGVLEIGCGGGLLVREIARAVGAEGRAVGLDANEEQIAAAESSCEGFANVRLVAGDATALPFGDGEFDRVVAINTLEYIPDTGAVLAEARRVLKPDGRLVNISVLWDHWQFHGADADLTRRLLDAWRAHCHHQMLPLELPRLLSEAGFAEAGRDLFTFMNTSLHENSYAHWAARILCAYAAAQGIADADIEAWTAQIAQAERDGRFGFFSASAIDRAVRLA